VHLLYLVADDPRSEYDVISISLGESSTNLDYCMTEIKILGDTS